MASRFLISVIPAKMYVIRKALGVSLLWKNTHFNTIDGQGVNLTLDAILQAITEDLNSVVLALVTHCLVDPYW